MTALATRREEARTVFEGHGLPTRRVEDWKYSDLKSALGDAGFGEGTAFARLLGRLPEGFEYSDLANPAPWAVAQVRGLRPGWSRSQSALRSGYQVQHATATIASAAPLA